MDRRTFLKGIGALATVPIIGKYFKLAGLGTKTATGIQTIKNTATQMPEWFAAFVSKMKSTAPERIDADMFQYKSKDLPGVTLTETADGKIMVEGKNAYDQGFEINYEAPKYLEDGTKFKGSFEAVDSKPHWSGPDAWEFDGQVVEHVDEILGGDAAKLKRWTTGEKGITEGERTVDKAETAFQSQLDDYSGYADGGLTKTIPPVKGPMSEGVASLFERR